MKKIKVYKYGLLAPTENANLVHEQMFNAHRYHNSLIEVERGKRTALRTLTRNYDLNVAKLEKELEQAIIAETKIAKEIKLQHSETRSRLSTKTDKDELKIARKNTKDIKKQLRDARHLSKSDPTIISKKVEINDLANAVIKSAREHCGVFWGTYLLIEDAMEASRKMPMYKGIEDNNPRFIRWKNEGSIGVQIQERNGQQGMDVKDVFGHDSFLRIDAINDNAFYGEKRSDRRKNSRTILRMRVGSEKGKPIWAAFPMIMHRSLPDGGVIKKATIFKKQNGNKEEWTVSFTVNMDNVLNATNNLQDVVAIDIGWRDMKDENGNTTGFRVAKSRGAATKEIGEIKIDPLIISGIKKSNELQGVRDDNFNAARVSLIEWMKNKQLPEWLTEETKTISQWRSISRLTKLVKKWSNNRFTGDEEIFGRSGKWNKYPKKLGKIRGEVDPGCGLASWAYHDFHLWNWEANQRTKSLRRRKEFYRIEAAKLAKSYQTCVLEDFDLRDVSQIAAPEDEDDNQKGRSNKTLSAPSEFRLAIVNAFTARNGVIAKINPAGTSYTCNLCGSKEKLDSTTHIHTCSKCKETWDRDDNATANLLNRWCEQAGDAKNAVSARNDKNTNENNGIEETRYQRRNRAKQEKRARLGTAREVVAKPSE